MKADELKKLQRQLDRLPVDDPDSYIKRRINLLKGSLCKDDGKEDLDKIIKRRKLGVGALKLYRYLQQRGRSSWTADTIFARLNQEKKSIRDMFFKNHSDPTNFNHDSNELWVAGVCSKKSGGHHQFIYRRKWVDLDFWKSTYFRYDKGGLLYKEWYNIQNIDFRKKIDANILK